MNLVRKQLILIIALTILAVLLCLFACFLILFKCGVYALDCQNKSEDVSVKDLTWSRCLDEEQDPCQDFYTFACGKYEPDTSKIKSEDWQMLTFEADIPIEKCLNGKPF
jgi:hypothetical protein